MLLRLHVKNFRLLRDADLEFHDVPTVLIGPNASGKSTVLEALDFLSRCADEGLAAATAAHGGFDGVRTIGAEGPIEIVTTWFFSVTPTPEEPRYCMLQWRLSLARAHNGGVRVERESLVDEGNGQARPLVADEGGRRLVLPENGSTDGPSEVTEADALAFHAFVDKERFPGLYWLRSVVRNVRVLGSLPTSPSWGRGNAAQTSPRDSLVIAPKMFLDRQGLGLANVLYALNTDHGEAWARLEGAFRAEFPFVRRILFPAEPGGARITFALEDARFPGRTIRAAEMSDGMVA
jgi:predicted ATPase